MNSKSLVLTITLIVLISILWSIGYIHIAYVSLYEYFNPFTSPERLDSIPPTAIWYGGRDGGVWIDFISIDNNDSCFECYVYNDFTGEQNLRAWWDNNIYCLENENIAIDSLKKYCSWYDGSHIGLKDGRRLSPDLSLFYKNFALIKSRISEEEVKVLLGTSYYLDDSDSTFNIWIYDVPIIKSPKIYFNKISKLVEKTNKQESFID